MKKKRLAIRPDLGRDTHFTLGRWKADGTAQRRPQATVLLLSVEQDCLVQLWVEDQLQSLYFFFFSQSLCFEQLILLLLLPSAALELPGTQN